MPRAKHDITDTELSILQVLWERGPLPIRALTEELYGQAGVSHYATVQKLLERLEEKECVERCRSKMPHLFSAVLARAELIGRRLSEMADRLCGGSLTPLLTHLVREGQLSEKDRAELRQMIADWEQPSPVSKKGRA